ncbi:GM22956 [Drosophila sechellia]|uniref:GM22956 n=1 Tax=Drosophila sechellia TaxID=7238 RepID=B4I746_DROSE|nr:GM22956 [Drosophila sechellia]
MDDGRWTMDDGRWTMDDGRWTMDDGRWTMDDGRWTMDDGRWTMDDGRWTMDDGQWTVDDEGAPTADFSHRPKCRDDDKCHMLLDVDGAKGWGGTHRWWWWWWCVSPNTQIVYPTHPTANVCLNNFQIVQI